MPVSRDAVIWGFRLLLGREPESEDAIAAHMGLGDEGHLAEVLLASPEFAQKRRIDPRSGPDAAAQNPPKPEWAGGEAPPVRLLLMGNCQMAGLGRLLEAMADGVSAHVMEMTAQAFDRLRNGEIDLATLASDCDLILLHPVTEILQLFEEDFPHLRDKVRRVPSINFSAFHPDLVYIKNGSLGHVIGPLGEYQSSLAFYGWRQGFSVAETMGLFAEDVFAHLGFFDYWESSKAFLGQMERATGVPIVGLLERWSGHGCWMHSINHPKLFVLADVARAVLAREGIAALDGIEQFVHDNLADGPVWPVYPEIGQRLGIPGGYRFKTIQPAPSSSVLGLKEFVQMSFEAFSACPGEDWVCERLDSSRYRELEGFLKTRQTDKAAAGWRGRLLPAVRKPAAEAAPPARSLDNPYRNLPDRQFWRRAVERLPLEAVDPVAHPRFGLRPDDKVATAGSCFAQHIASALQQAGCNYHIAEREEGLPAEAALRRNFGVFSARYGNIYTARQLLQLFERAYGRFVPSEPPWLRPDGKLADPFRPQIEPDGFASAEALAQSRASHFQAVRALFENLDVFVFTLGLTEAWRSRTDGAVFPLAPGVVAGAPERERHEFVNFGVEDVAADLDAFLCRLLEVNPRARMILTVSPVPLVATYEDRHVLVSTVYSKSALRVAAEQTVRRHPVCDYFPSYEIITGPHTQGAYFEADRRSIKPEGIDRVMRLFVSHYAGREPADSLGQELMRENARMGEVICDEEAIDAAAGPQQAQAAPP